jgi:hypothetical protein
MRSNESEGAAPSRLGADPIARDLEASLECWRAEADAAALRRELLAILAKLG